MVEVLGTVFQVELAPWALPCIINKWRYRELLINAEVVARREVNAFELCTKDGITGFVIFNHAAHRKSATSNACCEKQCVGFGVVREINGTFLFVQVLVILIAENCFSPRNGGVDDRIF